MPASAFQFGRWLRDKRSDAALSLRKFAQQIGDSPSNVCNIENGNRAPWKNESRLRKVAEVLGIHQNSEDWETLFGMVRRPGQPPADLARYMEYPYVPTLLRTIDEYQLSEEEIGKLLAYIKRKYGKARSQDEIRHR